ncbi:MAG TPA: CDP-alcohol phosphatidyltransferase family protein [Micromonosporaceae bacterium]|jgi:phosphatidylglycerophosphate synthase
MQSTATPARPTAASFLAQNRGGGWYSETISQRAGAVLALVSHRLGLAPAVLTIIGVVFGVGTSAGLAALASQTTTGAAAAVGVGLAAGLGWQIAYAFDCADGQLARVTGRTSATGARLDILCDVATQVSVVAALTAVVAAHTPGAPAWLYAMFAGTWMVNLVTSVLASQGAAQASLISRTSTAVRLVKLSRDYGAVIGLCALVVAFLPNWAVFLLVALTVLNGLFLLASIAQATRRSLIGPR